MRASEELGGQDIWTAPRGPLQEKCTDGADRMEQIEFILSLSNKDGNKADPIKIGLTPGT